MEIIANTLDDLMHEVLSKLLEQKLSIDVSKGRVIGEFSGSVLRLMNPRARLSRTDTRGKAFSALGELLWYLSKSNKLDFITYYIDMYVKYSDDNETVYGGYGPRIFNLNGKIDQFQNVIEKLREKSTSRQAVIQIFHGEDIIEKHNDVPCTCTLQFIIRDGVLNLIVYMRSNDAFYGLPHDIFSFTMIQEIIASILGIEIGEYVHMAGSLHLYESKKVDAEKYIGEGLQSTKDIMPNMPYHDVENSIIKLLEIEEAIRLNRAINLDDYSLDNYWIDLVKILLAFNYSKVNNDENLLKLKHIANSISSHYKPYIEKKWRSMNEELKKLG
jgi:thymidylate synthase